MTLQAVAVQFTFSNCKLLVRPLPGVQPIAARAEVTFRCPDFWRSTHRTWTWGRVSSPSGFSGLCRCLCYSRLAKYPNPAVRGIGLFSFIDSLQTLFRALIVFIKCAVVEIHTKRRIMQRAQRARVQTCRPVAESTARSLQLVAWSCQRSSAALKDTWTHHSNKHFRLKNPLKGTRPFKNMALTKSAREA